MRRSRAWSRSAALSRSAPRPTRTWLEDNRYINVGVLREQEKTGMKLAA